MDLAGPLRPVISVAVNPPPPPFVGFVGFVVPFIFTAHSALLYIPIAAVEVAGDVVEGFQIGRREVGSPALIETDRRGAVHPHAVADDLLGAGTEIKNCFPSI